MACAASARQVFTVVYVPVGWTSSEFSPGARHYDTWRGTPLTHDKTRRARGAET